MKGEGGVKVLEMYAPAHFHHLWNRSGLFIG